jgi:hypothetical protein
MGYMTSLEAGRHVMWKTVVKEIVLRKKKELRNWKVDSCVVCICACECVCVFVGAYLWPK